MVSIAFVILLIVISANHYPHSVVIFGADKTDHPHFASRFVSFDELSMTGGDVLEIKFIEPSLSSYFYVTTRSEYNSYDMQNKMGGTKAINISLKARIGDGTILYPVPFSDDEYGFFITNNDLSRTEHYDYRIVNHPEIEFHGSSFERFILILLLTTLTVFAFNMKTRRQFKIFMVAMGTFFVAFYTTTFLFEVPTIEVFLAIFALLLVVFLQLFPVDTIYYKKIKKKKVDRTE